MSKRKWMPVKIKYLQWKNRSLREKETLESSISGIYPCGEGAGYAGGITSAAMDGLKVAEAILKTFKIK